MSTKLSLKSVTTAKKIESPLAKYNSVGQLFCVLCNVQIKNEMYWTGHINGKAHRDQMILLKNRGKPPAPVSTASFASHVPTAIKRPASATVSSSSSSTSAQSAPSSDKNGISSTSDFLSKRLKLEDLELSPMGPPPLVSILKKAKPKTPSQSTSMPPPKATPPPKKTFEQIEAEEESLMQIESRFNISKMEEDEDEEPEEEEAEAVSSTNTETLPAGFFDDAKEDAKARGLEYKNPEEAEWDRFVKEIATEEVKSVALRTADDEDSAKDRELDEIEEQMKNWQRVVDLEKKAEQARKQLQNSSKQEEKMNESDEEEVDEDYDEDLDWRTKKF